MDEVTAISPDGCSASEVSDFVALVLAGGEVSENGLETRVANAKCLGFLRRKGCLVGVAGLKQPEDNYRNRTASNAKVALPLEAFPFELGWVFIMQSARGAKLSGPLCESVLAAVGTAGVFATSRSTNFGMHATLKKLGFQRAGVEWPSKQTKENLCLFVKNAA
jgi:predicted GNAT family N-acyltransferase